MTVLAEPAKQVSVKTEKLPVNGMKLFENHIRPLLVRHCLECHNEKKQEGEIRLDAWKYLKGDKENDPLVIKGSPEKSRLFEVILYHEDDTQMPPKGKIPDLAIVNLRKWIKIGAPWPAKAVLHPPSQDSLIKELQETHWAYHPVRNIKVPQNKNDHWSKTAIDRFIFHEMIKENLSPSPKADRRTLLRRVSIDLTGLPPTWDELQEFEKDSSENAFEKVVDRLLASPGYGIRWGRHWLDVARYGDTKGYVFTDEIRYPYSYTYRDYVVRAMNEDVPYNRFIKEQIAADHLGLPKNSEALAALGFLTVGNRFRKNKHDQIDDRIDVISRGLMGITASCSRCHDHKYDPIPTADYYSLYGIFNSSHEPAELPLIGTVQEDSAEYKAYLKGLKKREQDVENYRREGHQKILSELRNSAGDYLQFILKEKGYDVKNMKMVIAETNLRRHSINAWKAFLKKEAGENHPLFRSWHRLLTVPKESFAKSSQKMIEELKKENPSKNNPLLIAALTEKPLTNMYEVARVYGKLFQDVEKKIQGQISEPKKDSKPAKGEKSKTAKKESLVDIATKKNKVKFKDQYEEQIRTVLYVKKTPINFAFEDSARYFDRAMNNQINRLKKKIEQWKLDSPGTPPRAMVMLDKGKPVRQRIFLRGKPGSKGADVARQNFAIVSYSKRKPFSKGSGRLELAESIVDPKNPLTVRVLVNRVWMHHFNKGLVSSADDFGTRTEEPIHADLLDYLAKDFIQDGWSLKKLHKKILLSNVYQQASNDRPDMREQDPENAFFWKMNLRRLEYEAIRDSFLAVSGQLDSKTNGKPIDFMKNPLSKRRTIYGFVNRNNLPTIMNSFDFANPDASTSERALTIVPQQALFVMNSPFILEMAKSIMKNLGVSSQTKPAEVIKLLYQKVLTRNPDENEIQLAIQFIENESVKSILDDGQPEKKSGKLSNWERFAQVLLLTNEFSHVD